jgi:hypothetical protein
MKNREFKISGDERRQYKKELSSLKAFIKGYWHEHYMDQDMYTFYGGRGFTDEEAQEIYERRVWEIAVLEGKLKETL